MKRVNTFGTLDVFHIGYLHIPERSRQFGDYLLVGVSTDKMNNDKKGRYPFYTQQERLEIIQSMRCVNEDFP